MNNGYYAVILDKKSCTTVRQNATMDVVNGDHITIAYKPDNKTFNKLNKFIGQKVNAYFNELRANENIEAFWVKDMFLTETTKRFKRVDPGSAHITISHKKDMNSGEANTMFTNPTHKENRLGWVEGTFNWVPFNNEEDNE
jgi:hypothetical protein